MNTSFFFGANTPHGFKGYLDDLYNTHQDSVLLIKGSPGNGKNTIMKKVLEKLTEKNISSERIFCSSDPDSLDGIIVPSIHKCIFDATSPHIIEPKYWGVCESIIDLSHCLDQKTLKEKTSKLIALLDSCSYEHRKCCAEISKASFIIQKYASENEKRIDRKAVIRIAADYAEKLLPSKKGFPKEKRRFLSAITPKGMTFLKNTLDTVSDTQIIFEDPYYFIGHLFTNIIRDIADDKNLSYITCRCLFLPDQIDHIIFPEERISFSVSNPYIFSDNITLSFSDFLDNPLPTHIIMPDQFIERAVYYSKNAKSIHDDIESIYKEAMDFSLADEIADYAIDFFSIA